MQQGTAALVPAALSIFPVCITAHKLLSGLSTVIALCVQLKEIRNTWVVFLGYLRIHLSFDMQIPHPNYSLPFSNKHEFYFKCCVYA